MTHEEIAVIVNQSIDDLFDKDLILLQNDVSERALTHKLAEHLQTRFPQLNVDCEYNRDVTRGRGTPKSVKMLRQPTARELRAAADMVDVEQLLATSTYPDIIVHRRGCNEENLLVIEVKKQNSSVSHEHDYNKLKAFTENNEHNSYNFTYGIFILFETDCEQPSRPRLSWFTNGNEAP
jgi:hypothetical protein